MSAVVLDRVAKVYPNGVAALTELSLTAADGETLVLVGPSGSGKTTALRLVAGLEAPTAGAVRIGGLDVTHQPPHRRGVGLVFQRPALYPHLSVADNLAFGLEMSRPGLLGRLFRRPPSPVDVSARVAEVAAVLGLGDLLSRRPAELSGGQQQRVALGRALARRPGVLLLDEPLSGLDAGQRREMRADLHLLSRRLQATMLYVTHDQEEAMALADRVAVLDGGRLLQSGPPLEVYRRPADRLVAAFLGWPPATLLDGRLAATDAGLSFEGPGGRLPVPIPLGQEWGRFSDRPLTVGLRAEHLRLAARGATGEGLLTMRVGLVEQLGALSLVRLEKGGWRATAAQIGPVRLAEGDMVEAGLDLASASLFDGVTGHALAHAAPA
jgi:ABC-type sugar transport system ATPase subunit